MRTFARKSWEIIPDGENHSYGGVQYPFP